MLPLPKLEHNGLLPAIEGWEEWWAWRPVFACGFWRWMGWVQRRRVEAWIDAAHREEDPHAWRWEYAAGRLHRLHDSIAAASSSGHVHTCRNCRARFTI